MLNTQGQLEKIQLISNCICYGPMPDYYDEVEQRLTITQKGKVWLSRYIFGETGEKYILKEKQLFSIPKESSFEILEAVNEWFNNDYVPVRVTDVGSWNLVLTKKNGEKIRFCGSLIDDFHSEQSRLSDLIRKELNRGYLFAFDGYTETQKGD